MVLPLSVSFFSLCVCVNGTRCVGLETGAIQLFHPVQCVHGAGNFDADVPALAIPPRSDGRECGQECRHHMQHLHAAELLQELRNK